MTREFVQPGSKIVASGHLTGKELVQIVRGSAQETQTTTAAIAALGGAGIAIAGGVGSIPGVTSVTFSGATVTGTTPNATVDFPLTVQDVDDDVVTGVTSITFAGAIVSGTTPDAVVTFPGGGLGTGTAPVLQQTADQIRTTDASGKAVLNLLADDGLPSGDQGASSALELDAFGGGVPGSIIFGAARGVVGAPAALQSDDGISLIQYFGHDGASYSSPVVQEIVTAAENFDNTHHAASWSLSTVSLGADDEILTAKLGVDANGAIISGTPSGPATIPAGPGDINVQGRVLATNVVLSSSGLSGQDGALPDGDGTSLTIAAGSSVGAGEAGGLTLSSGVDGATSNENAVITLSGGSPGQAGGVTIRAGRTITAGNGPNVSLMAGTSGALHKAGDLILGGGDTAATAASISKITVSGIPADDGAGNQDGGSLTILTGVGVGTGKRGSLTITGLPTSASGLTAGMIWNNSGVLTIV